MVKLSLKYWILGMVLLSICFYMPVYSGSQTDVKPAGFIPSDNIIIPEVIWAPASGGGEWQTELVITDVDSSTGVEVSVIFYSGINSSPILSLWLSPGPGSSIKFSNIMEILQGLDTENTYYGKVGALWLFCEDPNTTIMASARIYNGDYGKSYTGMAWTDENTVNVGFGMALHNLSHNENVRSAVSVFNAAAGGYSMTADFVLVDAGANEIGSFSKSFIPWEYKAFDPFIEAGLGAGTYDNCALVVIPTSTGQSTPDRGLYIIGSSALTSTNDSYPHFPIREEIVVTSSLLKYD